MTRTIEELLIEHLGTRVEDTLSCYAMWEHEDWEDITDDGELIGFISYFLLDFKFDMVITAAKNNRFSKTQWRILRDTIVKRVKPLRIQSDPSNNAIQKSAKRFGGIFLEDEVWFPQPGYRFIVGPDGLEEVPYV